MARRSRPLPAQAREYDRIAKEYADRLQAWVSRVLAAAQRAMARTDADGWTPDELRRALAAVRAAIAANRASLPAPPSADQLSRALRNVARRAVRGAGRNITPSARRRLIALQQGQTPATEGDIVGVPLEFDEATLLQQWAEEGAALIQDVRASFVSDLATRVVAQAKAGGRWEGLIDVVGQQVSATRSHLRLIARDQTAKLNGRVTQQLQTRAGVTHYRWRTSGDERVRSSHAELEGLVFAWASEGVPGAGPYGTAAHPGQGIQCRCTAEPIIPDL